MNTGSAASRAAACQVWVPVLRAAGSQGQALGEEILAVAHQIALSRSLLHALTDPGRDGEAKAVLASTLFAPVANGRVVDLLRGLVRGRWSQPVHLLTALHDLGIEAILEGARSGGRLEAVEQELFGLREVIRTDRDLRLALEPSKRTTQESRVTLAHRVFAPIVSPATLALLTWCVRHRADGGVPYNLRRVSELAAALQERTIADVVSAVPLDTAQQERLRNLLRERVGTEIELNLDIDPAVVGGVRVTVRDTVIDSTVRTAIRNVRTSLAG